MNHDYLGPFRQQAGVHQASRKSAEHAAKVALISFDATWSVGNCSWSFGDCVIALGLNEGHSLIRRLQLSIEDRNLTALYQV